MNPSTSPSQKAYQFRIVIVGISPMVWRRVLIPCHTRLSEVSDILLTLFDWSGDFLHEFRIHGKRYSGNGLSTSCASLCDFSLRVGESIRYVYNFFDEWNMTLRLETVLEIDPTVKYPFCLAGKGAAPPEDCGGAWSYLKQMDERIFPFEALEVMTDSLKRFVGKTVAEIVGDYPSLEDAARQLQDYQDSDPNRFSRRQLNAQLHELSQGGVK